MTGILPLANQLGDHLARKPIEQPPTIRGPQRLTRGRWSDEAWAEICAIYDEPEGALAERGDIEQGGLR